MTPSELHQISPTLTEPRLSEYCSILTSELYTSGIIDHLEIAAFISQASHESAGFNRLYENLNYSTPDRIVQVWPSRFSGTGEASQYVKSPAKLANRVYANRMGNGDEESGDGYKYRGRGIFQLTGKNNYRACGDAIGINLISDPDALLEFSNAVKSAVWFWQSNHLGAVLKQHGIGAVSRKINGGNIGMMDRIAAYEIAIQALA